VSATVFNANATFARIRRATAPTIKGGASPSA
jgi:hypothetical protein